MQPTLPFDEFLVVLRARGYSVGVHEYLSLARLLERWPGTSSPEFADAVAALIARHEIEVAGIKRLYSEFYAPIEASRDGQETRTRQKPRPFRTRTWLAAVA